jgi:hypothetical protein
MITPGPEKKHLGTDLPDGPFLRGGFLSRFLLGHHFREEIEGNVSHDGIDQAINVGHNELILTRVDHNFPNLRLYFA